ncbi:hypothetical protein CC1G_06965 [Coprinopsis cinerea okayama7|uniref:Uncharacterized protein n=1 Tax=Coprinopsis cinerea (strain Okayama-7 / 130 / ATCC MYA-4618 / FGSC 9003) TaxID=240176 RepID=A8NZV6_COPC7|nr:hypothetical protein CC1G_06965 [Coprinopsis cinerea okayama7\|eukprot:XP_001837759.2 hypothetical protein CC1G_06965 [Coprinopsis cinerea okayama7\
MAVRFTLTEDMFDPYISRQIGYLGATFENEGQNTPRTRNRARDSGLGALELNRATLMLRTRNVVSLMGLNPDLSIHPQKPRVMDERDRSTDFLPVYKRGDLLASADKNMNPEGYFTGFVQRRTRFKRLPHFERVGRRLTRPRRERKAENHLIQRSRSISTVKNTCIPRKHQYNMKPKKNSWQNGGRIRRGK